MKKGGISIYELIRRSIFELMHYYDYCYRIWNGASNDSAHK